MASYWWLYKLGPMRRLVDPDWLESHSEAARWAEEQEDYQRLGTSPDLFFRGDRIGYYGDRKWCLWLVERIVADDEFRHCGCTDTALALMTNQRVSSWGDWLTTNGDRSQEEWIRDGFLEYGVTVHLPPTPDDAGTLLTLLGQQSENERCEGHADESDSDTVPGHIQYNAFRWLRDSGFQPRRFAALNGDLSLESTKARGILRYSEWHIGYPENDGLGVLAFGRHSETGTDGSDSDFRPRIAKPWLRRGVNGFIGVTTVAGCLLILFVVMGKASSNRAEQDNEPRVLHEDTKDESVVT